MYRIYFYHTELVNRSFVGYIATNLRFGTVYIGGSRRCAGHKSENGLRGTENSVHISSLEAVAVCFLEIPHAEAVRHIEVYQGLCLRYC